MRRKTFWSGVGDAIYVVLYGVMGAVFWFAPARNMRNMPSFGIEHMLLLAGIAAAILVHLWRLTLARPGTARMNAVEGDAPDAWVSSPPVTMSKEAGERTGRGLFALTSDLAVFSIFLLLFVVLFPDLRAQRIYSPESAAIGNMRTILYGENDYHFATGRYDPIEKLTGANPPRLDGKWTGVKLEYRYTVTVGNDGQSFKALAMPENKKMRAFYVDDSGVIRSAMPGKEPTVESKAIGE